MRRFFQNLMAIVAKLELTDRFQKKELSAEDQSALIKAYEEAYGADSFQSDFEAYQAEQAREERYAEQSRVFGELAELLGTESSAQETDSSAQILEAVRNLQATVAALGSASQGDTPEDRVEAPVRAYGPHTARYAFGVQHPLFEATRRYNRIAINRASSGTPTSEDAALFRSAVNDYTESLCARLNMHIANGTLQDVIKGTVDYSALTSDTEIGTRALSVRQDALISRLQSLPNLNGLFSKISNIQSGTLITNVLFTEVSQAYQAGRVFKGDINFQPEKGYVDKAMAKLQFEDMSAIERSYLNYLNKSGSDPIKWSLIEWIILEMAKQISNERIRRAIMGYRVEPKKNVAGNTMFASTGVIHRLMGLYDEKKVLPFLDAQLATYSQEDIGDVLTFFAETLSEKTEFIHQYALYVNEKHRPWFKAWYRAKYGTDTNYTGVVDKVPDYEIPIRWVPCMGSLKFIFATVDDNIILLENVPGEEFRMNFQRDLEEVIAYSYWMEGAGVGFAGVKKKDLAELKAADCKEQMVFMNWPAVALKADATTANAKEGIIFTTGANTSTKKLTDITNASEGVIYRIECGSTTNATGIDKSGKFSEISSAWNPTKVGAYIKVYYDKSDSKFHEVARGK